MQTELKNINHSDSETLNIDDIKPYKLVKVFGDALTYMAYDSHYKEKKQSVTNLVNVANKGNTYLSTLPPEILTHIAHLVVSNTVSPVQRKTIVR